MDEIEAELNEIETALHGRNIALAALSIAKLKGMLLAYQEDVNRWDLIKQDYEQGAKPGELAQKYRVPAAQVRWRAYDGKWPSPRKVEQALQKKLKAKNSFILDCAKCEHKFMASSGHAKLCGQCLAKNELEEYQRKATKAMTVKTCLQCAANFKPVQEDIAICNRCQADYEIERQGGRA